MALSGPDGGARRLPPKKTSGKEVAPLNSGSESSSDTRSKIDVGADFVTTYDELKKSLILFIPPPAPTQRLEHIKETVCRVVTTRCSRSSWRHRRRKSQRPW